ncbi:hypothetical protein BMIN10S_04046 [Bosea minatitlanensis]
MNYTESQIRNTLPDLVENSFSRPISEPCQIQPGISRRERSGRHMSLPGEDSRRPDNTADGPLRVTSPSDRDFGAALPAQEEIPWPAVPDWSAQAAVAPCPAPPPAAPGARARSTPSGSGWARPDTHACPAISARRIRPAPGRPRVTPTAPEKPRSGGLLPSPTGGTCAIASPPSVDGRRKDASPNERARQSRALDEARAASLAARARKAGSAPLRRPEPGRPARSRGRARRSAAAGRPRRP